MSRRARDVVRQVGARRSVPAIVGLVFVMPSSLRARAYSHAQRRTHGRKSVWKIKRA